MHGPPFKNFKKVWVIAPSALSSLSKTEIQQAISVRKLIEEHRGAIEREIGCQMEFSDSSNVQGPKWLIGPRRSNPAIQSLKLPEPTGPEIFLDRQCAILVTDGNTPEEVTETFSWV